MGVRFDWEIEAEKTHVQRAGTYRLRCVDQAGAPEAMVGAEIFRRDAVRV